MRRTSLLPLLLLAACGGGSANGTTPPPTEPPPTGTTYVVGQSYFGRNGYVEYVVGDAPVILAAPHGGALRPSEIPDRTAATCGGAATTVTDMNTVELARAMQERYLARFGARPHVIINHLARRKLDANRTAQEAACGDAEALVAFEEFHEFIDAAKQAVVQRSGRGLFIDVHGHGHAVPRLELGYRLSGETLDQPDATLDASAALERSSSVRTLSEAAPAGFSALLRGADALGTLYAAEGFPAVPSAGDPGPQGAAYFSGGENTERHGCAAGGTICAVQIEANFTGVRDQAANRERFGDATAVVLEQFLWTHWGLPLDG